MQIKIRLFDFWLLETTTWLRVKCKKGQILKNSVIVFTEKNNEAFFNSTKV